MWFFVVSMMIRAVVLKHVLWPQKQEDRDEGGWKTEAEPMIQEGQEKEDAVDDDIGGEEDDEERDERTRGGRQASITVKQEGLGL